MSKRGVKDRGDAGLVASEFGASLPDLGDEFEIEGPKTADLFGVVCRRCGSAVVS